MLQKNVFMKKRKYECKECGGNGICSHAKRKNICKDCKGVQ
jgi:DnaJ-class molecular chaperone